MKVHPAAELFPQLEGPEFDAFVADIKARGLVHPIVTLENEILDGRNRWRACREAKVEPRFEKFRGKDPIDYVISTNVARRHLDEGQRSIVAAKLAPLRAGRPGNKPANLPIFTQAEAATKLNISERLVRHARKVLDEGAPELIAAVNSGKMAVSAASEVAALPKDQQQAIVKKVEAKEISGAHAKTEVRKASLKASLEDVAARHVKEVKGVYDVLVIDPPWAMKKIKRKVRPNQTDFDYLTMTEEELKNPKTWFKRDLPCADACHVWVWTTQKFLRAALRLLRAWDLKYVCAFVWHKPGGPQPVGLPQFNCEFALYARRGSPGFVDLKNFMTCFNAPRGAHSEKPEEFYEMVRRVTAGRRLDIFNRRPIVGFDGWGNETKR